MAQPSYSVKRPDFRAAAEKQAAAYAALQAKAARIATDKVSREAQQLIKAKMLGVGLGRLSNAVLQTSALKKGTSDTYGAVYAAGGDQSLAGGALDAYSNGVTITAVNKTWLAFATPAIPSKVGRLRMTPALFVSSGLASSLGKLEFRPVNQRLALLVVRNTTQHVRTGRIKLPGKRRSSVRVPAKEVVCFVLIRFTNRAKRFDKDEAAAEALLKMTDYIADVLDQG